MDKKAIVFSGLAKNLLAIKTSNAKKCLISMEEAPLKISSGVGTSRVPRRMKSLARGKP